jgi:hypothetical protein
MVNGHRQAINAAKVAANACMDSLKLKAVSNSKCCQEKALPQTSPFSAVELIVKPRRTPLGNQSHRGSEDGEARVAQKASKPLRMYYSATMAVDT